mmetsp:Transcript_5097/g.15552  ORF Transcript_5097/g.15552 Transcript_5097/m.15552 type:complete len:206 (-) Transcript_5097:3949-4566(-)
MRDGDHGAIAEHLPNGVLDQRLGLVVDRRGGLVQHEDARVAKQCTGKHEQLCLASTQVRSVLGDLGTESTLESHHELLQVSTFQRVPDARIVVLAERIQIEAHRTAEQYRILWNDGELGAQIKKSDLRDVHTIDQQAATSQLDQAKQSQCNGALPRASSTTKTDLFAWLNAYIHTLEHQRKIRPIANLNVVEFDCTGSRPLSRWS